MKLVFRSGALFITLSAFTLTSCGKKEETPAAPASSESKSPAATATPAPAPDIPQMKEPPASAPAPAPAAAPANAASFSGEEREFFGTVGGQPIVAGLTIGADAGGSSEVKGWYYPEARGSGSKLTLSGTLKDGALTLNQITDGGVTATFELRKDTPASKTFMGNCMVQNRAIPTKLTAR